MFFSHMTKGREKRVVICALRTYSQIGGIQKFNARIVRALAKRAAWALKPEPLVLLLHDEVDALPRNAPAKFAVYSSNFLFVLNAVASAVWGAEVFVLCHVNLLPLGALARLLRPELPILLFVHGIEVWVKPVSRPKRWYEAWSLRSLTRIVAVSAYTAGRMTQDFGVSRGKFRLLPNAVDPIPGWTDPVQREPLTILTVNRMAALDREKNVDQMIRAVAKLAPSLPGLKYLIIGDGVLRPEFEALAAELGVGDIVEFCGWVGEAELQAAYARASVFAMPSSKEGFGIVYLEAWQRGLPVICSKDGAAHEIVADGSDGFVVDPADVSMIAERLRALLTQPELAKAMGERGRRKVETKYLDSMFQSGLYEIIDEMVPAPAPIETKCSRLRADSASGPRQGEPVSNKPERATKAGVGGL